AQTAGDFFHAAIEMAGAQPASYVAPYAWPGAGPRASKLFVFGERYQQSMAARLYVDDGKGLAHFRLVYASPQRCALAYPAPRARPGWARLATPLPNPEVERSWRAALASGRPVTTPQGLVYDGIVGPSVKVFEQVAGAHLTGTVAPGE